MYLGSNLSIDSVIPVIDQMKPQYLLLFLVHYDLPEQIQKSLDKLASSFNGTKIYLAGNQKLIEQINLNVNTEYLQSVESLAAILKSSTKLNTYNKI